MSKRFIKFVSSSLDLFPIRITIIILSVINCETCELLWNAKGSLRVASEHFSLDLDYVLMAHIRSGIYLKSGRIFYVRNRFRKSISLFVEGKLLDLFA